MLNLENIKTYAFSLHESVNHKYDIYDYSYHLNMVKQFAYKFREYIDETDLDTVYAICYLHDTIEDCRVNYNDILKISNETVVNAVYALTNEKGKTRKDRANEKYYQGIVNTEFAVFVKLCDRLANVSYSKNNSNTKFNMYKKENKYFLESLKLNGKYNKMVILLNKMLNVS